MTDKIVPFTVIYRDAHDPNPNTNIHLRIWGWNETIDGTFNEKAIREKPEWQDKDIIQIRKGVKRW